MRLGGRATKRGTKGGGCFKQQKSICCMFKFKLGKKDHRGVRYSCRFGNQKWLLITIKQGKYRGGHAHNFEQVHLLLSGKLAIFTQKGKTKRKIVLLPGGVYRAKKGEFHLFKALQGCIFIEPAYREKATLHPTWRKRVEKDK